MSSPRAQSLIADFETNTWLIHKHIDGISNEESLLQLPFPANCLNWVLGHIVWRRNSALSVLGVPILWDEDITAKYMSGSPPITTQVKARRFTDLIADLDHTQQALSNSLQTTANAELDKIVENDRGAKRVIEHLRGFHWHETYHIGQLDILQAYVISRR